jgi:hypothetical protein
LLRNGNPNILKYLRQEAYLNCPRSQRSRLNLRQLKPAFKSKIVLRTGSLNILKDLRKGAHNISPDLKQPGQGLPKPRPNKPGPNPHAPLTVHNTKALRRGPHPHRPQPQQHRPHLPERQGYRQGPRVFESGFENILGDLWEGLLWGCQCACQFGHCLEGGWRLSEGWGVSSAGVGDIFEDSRRASC